MFSSTDKEIEFLMSNRDEFDKFVYTPLEKVLDEIGTRQKNAGDIDNYLLKTLPSGVPQFMQGGGKAIVFVQIATPNTELIKYIDMVKSLEGFKPAFFEYLQDKFTDNNEWKYNLGRLSFIEAKDKNGKEIVRKLNVIDFNKSRGKKLVELETIWGQKLVDFHHELFGNLYPKDTFEQITFFDASEWFGVYDSNPHKYYESFFKLFLKNNVLFENYMLNEREIDFTRDHILPALLKIRDEIGVKPLIVNIQPTDIEGLPFWMYHPHSSIDLVSKKINDVGV